MSPFERAAQGLADQIARATPIAQVALLASAAQALSPGYFAWCAESGQDPQAGLLSEAIDLGKKHASGHRWVYDTEFLVALERATPAEPSDRPDFTVAQDCWVLADSALRVAAEKFDAQN